MEPQFSSYARLDEVVEDHLSRGTWGFKTRQVSEERRSTFRCPVLDDQQAAVLVVDGETQHEARVIDQSIGGFAVFVLDDLDVCIGQSLRLQTSNGDYEVAAIYKLCRDDVTRLGLKRLREIVDLDVKPDETSGVSGTLTIGTLFLLIVFASVIFFRYALRL